MSGRSWVSFIRDLFPRSRSFTPDEQRAYNDCIAPLYTDMDSLTDVTSSGGYGIRKCRGHWHCTYSGNDLALPGDPFATADAALDALDGYVAAAVWDDARKQFTMRPVASRIPETNA